MFETLPQLETVKTLNKLNKRPKQILAKGIENRSKPVDIFGKETRKTRAELGTGGSGDENVWGTVY